MFSVNNFTTYTHGVNLPHEEVPYTVSQIAVSDSSSVYSRWTNTPDALIIADMMESQLPNWNDLFADAMLRASTVARGSRGELADWDKNRAIRFQKRTRESNYARELLRRIAIPLDSTVLDVGCGPGALSFPIARQARLVTAVDMSENMLKIMKEMARQENITNIQYVHNSWLAVKPDRDIEQHDIVICSRSIHLVSAEEQRDGEDLRVRWDLAAALAKMNRLARSQVFVTSWAPFVSRLEQDLCRLVGKTYVPPPDYIHIYNVLYQMGIYADIEFWTHERKRVFATVDEATEDFVWLLNVKRDADKNKLREYLEVNLVEDNGSLAPREIERRDIALLKWKPVQ